MAEHSLVHGLHAVRWLLQRHPERVRQIWMQKGREDVRAAEIVTLARGGGIAIQTAEARTLDTMSATASHQGVVAAVVPSEPWNDAHLQQHLRLRVPAGVLVGLLCLRVGRRLDPHRVVEEAANRPADHALLR